MEMWYWCVTKVGKVDSEVSPEIEDDIVDDIPNNHAMSLRGDVW